MNNTIAKRKYKSIRDRSFKTYLDLFLICCYIHDKSLKNTAIKEFQKFSFNHPKIKMQLKHISYHLIVPISWEGQ